MATPNQTPVLTHAPPILPPMQGQSEQLINYLRSLSLWASTNLSNKLSATQALPGVLLQANDTVAGAAPKVFLLQVNSAGAITATAQPLGQGKP